jgi:hypothetical protein
MFLFYIAPTAGEGGWSDWAKIGKKGHEFVLLSLLNIC